MRFADWLVPLAARLRATYTEETLRRLLGIGYPDDVGRLNHAPAVERLRGDRSVEATLIRLFFLEVPVRERDLARAVPRSELDRLVRVGLLARGRVGVRGRLRMDAVGGRYFFADRRLAEPDPGALGLPQGDMVYPPCADSVMLAHVVAPRAGGTVLDLCTGSGIQGVAVAQRARDVLGIDMSTRAATLARINAALNGVSNFDARVGDLYAAVRGRRFDTIIANPPFVPSPRRGPSYHSGGPRGDRVLRRVVAGFGAHLSPGGRAFVISHLALRRGEEVADAVRPWLVGFRGRCLALSGETGSPVDLAAAQSVFALDAGLDAYAAEVRRWVGYLDRHRIDRIVLLILAAEAGRRRALDVVDAAPRSLSLPLSKTPREHVSEWFAAAARG